jgi:hypothetical protein
MRALSIKQPYVKEILRGSGRWNSAPSGAGSSIGGSPCTYQKGGPPPPFYDIGVESLNLTSHERKQFVEEATKGLPNLHRPLLESFSSTARLTMTQRALRITKTIANSLLDYLAIRYDVFVLWLRSPAAIDIGVMIGGFVITALGIVFFHWIGAILVLLVILLLAHLAGYNALSKIACERHGARQIIRRDIDRGLENMDEICEFLHRTYEEAVIHSGGCLMTVGGVKYPAAFYPTPTEHDPRDILAMCAPEATTPMFAVEQSEPRCIREMLYPPKTGYRATPADVVCMRTLAVSDRSMAAQCWIHDYHRVVDSSDVLTDGLLRHFGRHRSRPGA